MFLSLFVCVCVCVLYYHHYTERNEEREDFNHFRAKTWIEKDPDSNNETNKRQNEI